MTNSKKTHLSTFISSCFLLSALYAPPAIAIEPSVFDIDGNGKIDPLTDGLLTIRYLFNFRGNTLINGAIGTGAIRDSAVKIETYLNNHLDELDIDGNGRTKALSDGLLMIRYLFGFRGDTLIRGAIGDGATRKTADDIKNYFKGTPTDIHINTPVSKRCTSYGMSTFSFLGRVTGTGTVSVQPYTKPDICSGTKNGAPYIDNNLTYSLSNLKYAANSSVTATMKVFAFGRQRSRNVTIKNGIVIFK